MLGKVRLLGPAGEAGAFVFDVKSDGFHDEPLVLVGEE